MIRAIAPGAMTILAAVASTLHILLGLQNLGAVSDPGVAVAALALYALATALVLQPRRNPIHRARLWAAVVAVPVITGLVCVVLPTDGWPGYAAWHPAAVQTLMIILAVRGHVRLAWAGVAVFVVINTGWALTSSIGLAGGLSMAVGPVGWLLIATGVMRLLGSSDRRIARYRDDAARAADRDSARRAQETARTTWVAHVRGVAGSSLEQVADRDSPLTTAQRRQLLLVEAQLRDGIRGRALATELVIDAARRARTRGVDVALLDDRGSELDAGLLASASDRIVEVLDRAGTGTVTARTRPQGARSAVTIMAIDTENDDDGQLIEIGGAG